MLFVLFDKLEQLMFFVKFSDLFMIIKLIRYIKSFLWYLHRPQKAYKRIQKTSIPLLLSDARYNAHLNKNLRHILIVRHFTPTHPFYNNHFLQWVHKNYPEISSRIRLKRLSGIPANLENTALFIPWLQDPLKERFPRQYQKAFRLQQQCQKQGIPVINSVDSLSRSIKSVALKLIAQTGIRTAKAIPITDGKSFNPGEYGLSYPLIIREDQIHSTTMSFITNEENLNTVAWENFKQPVAMEFIDVKGEDNYYRKYRYVLVGNTGAPRHLIISKKRFVRADDRVDDDVCREEEWQYTQSFRDPNHDLLNQARKVLGFDIVAFDYSYDNNGEIVVWEPNPFPVLWQISNEKKDSSHQLQTINRLYKVLLDYYLEKAGIRDHF